MGDLQKRILKRVLEAEEASILKTEGARRVQVKVSPEEAAEVEKRLEGDRRVMGIDTAHPGVLIVHIEAPTQQEAEAQVREILGVQEGSELQIYSTEPSGAMGEQEPEPAVEPSAEMGEEGSAEEVAKAFHETYERLAPEHGYDTRDASAKPWDEVPEENKNLMIATVKDLLDQGVITAATPEEPPVETPPEEYVEVTPEEETPMEAVKEAEVVDVDPPTVMVRVLCQNPQEVSDVLQKFHNQGLWAERGEENEVLVRVEVDNQDDARTDVEQMLRGAQTPGE